MSDDLSYLDAFAPPPVKARNANFAAQGANADEAASAYTIAPQVGVPPAVVQWAPKDFKAQAELQANNHLTDTTPKLAEFVSDPAKAAAVKDDYPALAKLSQIIDPDGAFAFSEATAQADTGFLAGVSSGYSHQNYARLAAGYQAGAKSLEPTLRGYESGFEKEQRYTGFQHYVNALGGFIGSTASSAQVGAAGAAAGSVLGPAGAVAGFGVGFLGDIFATISGQGYRALDMVHDVNGNPLPEGVKQATALAGGAVATAIGGFAGGVLGKVAGGLVTEAMTAAIAKPGVAAAIAKGAGETAKGALIGGTINTGIALSQEMMPIIAKSVSGQTFTNDPEQMSRLKDSLTSAFVDGALLFGGLHTIPIGVNYLRDRQAIEQTKLDAEQRLSIVGAMQVSKTNERSADLMREYIASHDYPDIQISAEAVHANRDAFSYVPDLDEHLARELPVGGDITIPAADYFTRTKPELINSLNEKVRGVSGLTPEEAQDLHTGMGRYELPKVEAPEAETEGEVKPLTKLDFQAADEAPGRVLQATSDAIQTQRKAMWLDPIIAPDATNMTSPSFARMSKAIQEVQADITKKAYDAAAREEKRRQTPLWKADLLKETEGARADLERDPTLRAYDALAAVDKDAPESLKFSREAVDSLLPDTGPDQLRSGFFPKAMFAKDGQHPDLIAEYTGFNSGKELLDALRKHQEAVDASGKTGREYFNDLVKAEGARRMEEKHGNLQENISAAAIEAALSVKQIDVLIQELKQLDPNEKVTREGITNYAQDMFGGSKAGTIKSRDIERRVGKYGEQAFREMQKGNAVEAFKAKQRQLINLVLAKEARAFEREKAATETIMDRYSGKANIPNVDQRYTDQMHNILANIGRDVPRSRENLLEALTDKNGKPITLRDFIQNVENRTGFIIHDADVLHPREGELPKKYADMTVDDVRALKDTLISLNEGGRKAQTITVNGKEVAFAEARDKLVDQLAEQYKDIDPTRRDAIGQMKHVLRAIDAGVLRAEQLFMWLDKNDPFGDFTSLLYRPMKTSEHGFTDQLKSVADDWNKHLPLDKEWRKSMNEKVPNRTLTDEGGRAMPLYRDNMMAIALNTGNDWNFRVLTKGMGWHPDEVTKFLNDNMTKKDWDMAHAIWRQLENLWPDVREAGRRRSGVAPERIPAREIETPHGTYKGGYYPLMADVREAQTLREKAFGLDQGHPFITLKSVSSATQARTGATYKLDLSLDRLPYTIRETLHEVHFGESLMNVAKFITDPKFREGLDNAFGPEYTDSLKPWLNYVATDGGTPDPSSLGWLTKGSRFLRQNMVTELVGHRLSTVTIHGGSAAANSLAEIVKNSPSDARWLRETNKILHKDPATQEYYARQWAEESGELRNRFHVLDRDMGAVIMRGLSSPTGLTKLGGDQFDRAAYQAFATKPIAYFDYASALVVYGAKRAEMLSKGVPLSDAIYAADQAVRVAHGSSGMIDLPAISRQNEALKWFTSFYGYFNHNYNRLRDTWRYARDADYHDPATYWNIVARTVGYLAVPAAIHEAVRHERSKDSSWYSFALKAGFSQIGGGLPFVRDIARAVGEGKRPDQVTPLQEVMGGMVQSGIDAYQFAHGTAAHPAGTAPKDWVAHALQTPGWFVGHLPGAGKILSGVTTKTGSGMSQFLWDKANNTPGSWDADYMRLLMDGNYHPRKHK